MRLLVLDGSQILNHLVKRLAPDGVEIETAATFSEAHRTLCRRPPDAVIVNLGPSELPWREIQRCCHEHDPPIPVLFESCVSGTPEEAGLGELNGYCTFLHKPYHAEELRAHIGRLLNLAAQRGSSTAPSPPPSRPTSH